MYYFNITFFFHKNVFFTYSPCPKDGLGMIANDGSVYYTQTTKNDPRDRAGPSWARKYVNLNICRGGVRFHLEFKIKTIEQ